MKSTLVAVLSLAVIGLGGCADQSEQKFKNRAKAEGEADADANAAAQEKIALKMEADLARLQRFYEGVRGLYKGKVTTPSGRRFNVQFNIHPTVELYEGTRIRTAEEITNDLKILALDIAEQTGSVLGDGTDMTLTCSYVDIKPGVDKGFFNLEAEGCPRFFQVNVVPAGSSIVRDTIQLDVVSRSVASDLLNLKLAKVTQLQVEMRTRNIPEPMTFTMKRVK